MYAGCEGSNHPHTCMHAHMYMYMHACTLYTCMHAHMYMYMHACTLYTCMHAHCTHACMHTVHMHAQSDNRNTQVIRMVYFPWLRLTGAISPVSY